MTTLRTERLELRPATRQDADALREHWNHPDVRRYLFDGKEVDPTLVATLIAESDIARDGYGLWRIHRDGALVGVCGLRPHESGEVELLYSLDPSHWGHGLVTEAARAVLTEGAKAGLTRILIETDEDNEASQRVAVRLGAVDQGSDGRLRRYLLSLP
ncbi:RimJ/RimL family protein N-acetyltransferase [Thermocatellispora tengchongensis]|uniref:RimJ/RimL family protein N-acetyltransferase n=1 Tax=Thermocatellispora tengchongensis TaxID=1073253 RepID=A0A840P9T2_9ACTN|nr:GNAT family N-acetyltransferase [Thermocatellispora tengchongensis]MBB5132755.1 RimJ/RimL family protein N-acetyltransferase [Thermocatellispora tengchongensis]